MSLFVMGDMHLSLNSNKSMDVFKGWENYTERIEKNWKATVSPEDTVVLAGDISWGMSLSEALSDFKFIDALPGKKIILKGNHDYWWATANKINTFFSLNGLSTLHILHNNSYETEDAVICGTRGWLLEENAAFTEEDKKIVAREKGRLELSLKSAQKSDKKKIVFLHYPPIFGEWQSDELTGVMKQYGVSACYYGHIHSYSSAVNAYNGIKDGIEYRLISADYIKFVPYKIL